MSVRPRQDLWVVLCCGLLLVTASITFMAATASLFLPVLTALATLVAVALPRPLPASTRSYIWTPVLCVLLLIVVGSETFFSEETLFILPTKKYGPIGIGIAMACLFMTQSDWTVAIVVSATYLISLLCGAPLEITPEFRRLFFCISLVQLGLLGVLMSFYSAYRARSTRGRRSPRDSVRIVVVALVALLTVGLLMGLEIGFFKAYAYTEQRLPEWMMRRMQRSRNQWFERTSTLWMSPPAGFMERRGVTLRVESERAPGYLRGYGFETYLSGKWSSDSTTTDLPYDDSYAGVDLLSPFYREASTNGVDPAQGMTIFTAAGFNTKPLLVPGVARRFLLVAESIAEDGNGALEPQAWQRLGGYVIDGVSPAWNSAYQGDRGVGGTNVAVYLQIPANVTAAVSRAVSAAFEARSVPDAPQAKALLIAYYFQTHFRYQLGVPMARGKQDPVEQFLETHHAGHCELFASATVLMLRQLQVPARYVTGCLALEPHPSRRYWVARENTAHAWVEAYDHNTRRWFLVESTPPDGRPSDREQFGWLSAAMDRLRMQWSKFRSLLAQGAFVQWFMYAREGIVGLGIWLATTRWGLATLGAVAAGLLFWGRFRRRAARERQHQLHHLLHQLERRLKRDGLVRRGDETVREFSLRVEAAGGESGAPAAELLRRYEALRYGTAPGAESEAQSLARAVDAFCRQRSTPA